MGPPSSGATENFLGKTIEIVATRARWGCLQWPPDALAGFEGRFAAGGRGWAGEGEGGGKGRAPVLLLNHGPSEPCYATDGRRTPG